MRIGIYIPNCAVPIGRERNVSGHAQLPLHAAKILSEHGHEVELFITKARDEYVLPAVFPTEIPTHLVVDGRKRGEIGHQHEPRTSPWRVLTLSRDLARLALERRLDLLHVFAFPNGAALFGTFRRLGFPVPIVCSLLRPLRGGSIRLRGYRGLDAITAPTAQLRTSAERLGLSATWVPHSAVRQLSEERETPRSCPPSRVLFWREASRQNGADICLDAFRHLAPSYPGIQFTFAVRDHRDEIPGLADAEREHRNIEIHRFPYAPGLGLAELLAESVCACLPLRKQTAHPQLAVLESLETGVPVICLDIGDMSEIVEDGTTGIVLDNASSTRTAEAIASLLDHPSRAAAMRSAAKASTVHRHWNRFGERMDAIYATAMSR